MQLPPCPLARRANHFSCLEHAPLELEWLPYNKMGGWFAQAKARKSGEAIEVRVPVYHAPPPPVWYL